MDVTRTLISESSSLPDRAPDNEGELPQDITLSDGLRDRLASLASSGWAVEWYEADAGVTCHLILFSSRRVQGTGADAEAAAREALNALDEE